MRNRVVLRIVGGLLLVCLVALVIFYLVLRPASSEGPQPASGLAAGSCEEQGGRVEVRTTANGDQYGYCIYPDGRECVEWTFCRCNCGETGDADPSAPAGSSGSESAVSPGTAGPVSPGAVSCEGQGGRVEIRTAADGRQYGYCIYPDGRECAEWTFCLCDCGPTPNLSLHPELLSPGQTFQAIGSGFEPEASIALRLGAPNAGLGRLNLATAIVDASGDFGVELTLPAEWPGTSSPVIERDLIIAAVDETRGQTLAAAPLVNESAADVECFDDCMIFAREKALAYVSRQYAQPVPAPEAQWELATMEESMAAEGSPARLTYRFTFGTWAATVSYETGTAEPVVYAVDITDSASGFEWTGTVDTSGQVAD
jgi:putative hemolysin